MLSLLKAATVAIVASLAFMPPNPVAMSLDPQAFQMQSGAQTHQEIGIIGEIDINSLAKLDLELTQIEENPPSVLIVVINSPGGYVAEGKLMARRMSLYPGRMVCMVDRDALSMALFIFETCQTR